jgi:DNA-binding NarL/FixJ family response regulator
MEASDVIVSTIAVVDDHEVVAIAIRSLVDTHETLKFGGSATTVVELTRSMASVDLVLLDLNLRDGSTPTENIAALRAWGAGVVAFTSGEQPFLMREAAHGDVLCIVRKSTPAEVLLNVLAQAARGKPVATTEWAATVESDDLLKSAQLTRREREVLALYASGLGAKAVARELFISENTVEDHLRRIRREYNLRGREAGTKVDLYRRGLEDGYLPLPTGL